MLNLIAIKLQALTGQQLKMGQQLNKQAIEMFFKGRDLDPIEGIYTVPDWGLVAITKHKDGYRQYVIDVIFSGLNGTHETTYFKTQQSKRI